MAFAGIPLCVVVSPLAFGAVVLVAHLVDLVTPLAPEQWETLRRTAFALPELWAAVRGRESEIAWGRLAVLLVAPGMVLMLVAWPFVRRLQRIAGAGTLLDRIPSRAIDRAVLREQQFANVVEEMALSAGVPVPRVRLIDTPAANIAAIGLTSADATILATTGFLDELSRDERQAMVAHLIGSVGNGDLEIAAVILSVVETWGLVAATLEAVVFPGQRKLVRRFVAASRRSIRGTVRPGEARAVVEPLLVGGIPDPMAVAEGFRPESCTGVLFGVLILAPLLATVGLASIAARQVSALLTVLGFGPPLAAMWRSRRRLADATAVQLTRNPTALADAVRRLSAADVEIPEAWPVYLLFPVWVPVSEANVARAEQGAGRIVGMRLEAEPRLESLAQLGAALADGAPRRSVRERFRAAVGTPREIGMLVVWTAVAVVGLGALVAMSLVLTTALLAALWWVAGWLTAPLRWARRLG